MQRVPLCAGFYFRLPSSPAFFPISLQLSHAVPSPWLYFRPGLFSIFSDSAPFRSLSKAAGEAVVGHVSCQREARARCWTSKLGLARFLDLLRSLCAAERRTKLHIFPVGNSCCGVGIERPAPAKASVKGDSRWPRQAWGMVRGLAQPSQA